MLGPTVIATAVEIPMDPIHSLNILGLTSLVAVAFAVLHLESKRLHRWLFKSEQMAISFSGGMAVTYVFIHLLPELAATHQLLGKTPMHFIALLGFIVFYGLQRLAWKNKTGSAVDYTRTIFGIQLFFVAIYNFLLIYAMPEQFEQHGLFALIYILAMGLHLLATNHSLSERYGQLFHVWGRYVLVAAITAGLVTDIFSQAANAFVSDLLLAILAGFVLFNVFKEELPNHETGSFRYFLTGVVVYIILLTGCWMVV